MPSKRKSNGTHASGAVQAHGKRTFGYVRVSTDMQAEDGQSLDVQQRLLAPV